MSIQEAQDYHHRVKNNPDMAIPGRPVPAPDKGQKADLKGTEKPTPAADGKDKGKPAQDNKAPGGAQGKDQPTAPDKAAAPAPAADGKDKGTPAQDNKAPGAAQGRDQPTTPEKAAAPAADGKDKGKDEPAEGAKVATDAAPDKGQTTDPKAPEKGAAPAAVGPAAKGPAGTAISQVLPERLSPPDEAAKKDFPAPKEGESIFVTLHPAYLVKSEYNTISVDPKSEDYQELKKSIELNGVKDPVLARIGDAGTLEIVSGQRRHMIATELNYPVPTIIQKISDPDVKILVADGNLHRPKISTHDLARSLRMKMEGMKQKSGRRKKGTFKAEELDSDVKLAQEMGMPVSKLNRLIRMSEATKDVCDRVDGGSLTLSVASVLSFLTPKNQDNVLHLMDLGYKVPAERVEYMKKVEKAGKLDEESMRAVLDGKNVLDPPKQEPPGLLSPPPPPRPPSPRPRTCPSLLFRLSPPRGRMGPHPLLRLRLPPRASPRRGRTPSRASRSGPNTRKWF